MNAINNNNNNKKKKKKKNIFLLFLELFTAEPQGVPMVALKPLIHNNKGKGKAIPEQVWRGP